jgi:threonine synthase
LPLDFKGWRCPACGRALKLTSGGFKSLDEIIQKGRAGIWRYSGAIPFAANPVTLGEGETPLIKAGLDGVELFLKLEYVSPTGAFKDRGASVSMTRAAALGVGCVVEDSTGNAGIAASAYAARAGIRARIYVPADAPTGKKGLMAACGSEVVECSSRGEAAVRAVSELRDGELYIGHAWDPFYLEGMKTAAFEIFEAGVVPDAVITPVASGTLLLGLHKGFRELLNAGLINEMPRIYGVQGEGCAPIYEDMHGKIVGGVGSSLADGLRIVDPPRRGEIVDAIGSTGGDVFVVSDPEIAISLRRLHRMGILAEPTSATALAAVMRNRREMGEVVVMPVTGAGIKNLGGLMAALGGYP